VKTWLNGRESEVLYIAVVVYKAAWLHEAWQKILFNLGWFIDRLTDFMLIYDIFIHRWDHKAKIAFHAKRVRITENAIYTSINLAVPPASNLIPGRHGLTDSPVPSSPQYNCRSDC